MGCRGDGPLGLEMGCIHKLRCLHKRRARFYLPTINLHHSTTYKSTSTTDSSVYPQGQPTDLQERCYLRVN